MPDRARAVVPPRPATREQLADEVLIELLAGAVRHICGQLTAAQLREMRHSVEQACVVPRHIDWDRRAMAHAEIFGLLADAAGHQALARMLGSGVGFAHHLMVTAGPAAGMMTANSRQRLLAFLSAADPEGAAQEMERHLRVLRFMGSLAKAGTAARQAPAGHARGPARVSPWRDRSGNGQV